MATKKDDVPVRENDVDTPAPPNDKNKEILAKLIEIQTVRFNYTRDIEFRVNIGIWGAMIAGAFAVMSKADTLKIATCGECLVALIIGVLLCYIHCRWMQLIVDTQQLDKDLIKRYRGELQRLVPFNILPNDEHDDGSKSNAKQDKLSKSWIAYEVGMTVVIYLAIIAVLWKP